MLLYILFTVVYILLCTIVFVFIMSGFPTTKGNLGNYYERAFGLSSMLLTIIAAPIVFILSIPLLLFIYLYKSVYN